LRGQTERKRDAILHLPRAVSPDLLYKALSDAAKQKPRETVEL
jgi:hypothetical protein